MNITLKNEEGFFHSAKEKIGIQRAEMQNPDGAEGVAGRTVAPTKDLTEGNCHDLVSLFKDSSGERGQILQLFLRQNST